MRTETTPATEAVRPVTDVPGPTADPASARMRHDHARGATTHIRPRGRWPSLGLREAWGQRELLGFLLVRDIKLRYRQSILGIGWALLQPLATMAVFTFVFHKVARIEVGDIPYPVFALAGLLPWLLFQTALVRSSESMANHSAVLTKVYFPRLLIPVSTTATAIVDFAISFVVLLVAMGIYAVPFTWRLLTVPLFVAFALASALSVGLWLTALHAKYRDIGQLLPFLVRLAMFVSPVAYPLSTLTDHAPGWARWILAANPMSAVLEGFRWAAVPGSTVDVGAFVVSLATVMILLVTGLLFFRRVERTLADVL